MALTVLTLTFGVVNTGTASAIPFITEPVIVIPQPTGPYAVGSTALHLVDHDRADPFLPQHRRELMVTVTYPATYDANYPLAHYFSAETTPNLAEAVATTLGVPVPMENLFGLHSNSLRGAPVITTPDRSLPVILFSPGAVVPRAFGTIAAEDLASRGYVVISMDHTHEVEDVEFPGDRNVSAIAAPEDEAANNAWTQRLLDARIGDTRFVLDQVEALADGVNIDAEHNDLPVGLSAAIDPDRIGMYGHSLGGYTTAEAMSVDPRIKVGADLDGALGIDGGAGAAADSGLDRPLLMLSSQQTLETGQLDASWTEMREHSTGWVGQYELLNASHYSFTDLQMLLPSAMSWLAPSYWQYYNGTIEPTIARTIVTTFLAGLFDKYLRGDTDTALDYPSPFPQLQQMN